MRVVTLKASDFNYIHEVGIPYGMKEYLEMCAYVIFVSTLHRRKSIRNIAWGDIVRGEFLEPVASNRALVVDARGVSSYVDLGAGIDGKQPFTIEINTSNCKGVNHDAIFSHRYDGLLSPSEAQEYATGNNLVYFLNEMCKVRY